jgi:hypothetical protein
MAETQEGQGHKTLTSIASWLHKVSECSSAPPLSSQGNQVPLDDNVEADCRSWRQHNLPGPGLEDPVRKVQQQPYPPGRPPTSKSQDGHRALAAARSETELSAPGLTPSEGADSECQASFFERLRCASLAPEDDPARNATEAGQGMYEHKKRLRRKTRPDRYNPKRDGPGVH